MANYQCEKCDFDAGLIKPQKCPACQSSKFVETELQKDFWHPRNRLRSAQMAIALGLGMIAFGLTSGVAAWIAFGPMRGMNLLLGLGVPGVITLTMGKMILRQLRRK